MASTSRSKRRRAGKSLRAKFLVGCDGGNSSTRGWIGSRLVGSTYAERWLVIDGRMDNHGVDNITFFCDPRRPTVRLPAVGSRVRWEFVQLAGETPAELVSGDSVSRLLAPFVGSFRRRDRTARGLHVPCARRR